MVIRSKYPLLPVYSCGCCVVIAVVTTVLPDENWRVREKKREERKYEGKSQLIQLLTASHEIEDEIKLLRIWSREKKKEIMMMKKIEKASKQQPMIPLENEMRWLLMYFSSLLTSVKLTNMCLYQLSTSASFQGRNIYSTASSLPFFPLFCKLRAIFLSHPSVILWFATNPIEKLHNWTKMKKEGRERERRLNGLRSGISKDDAYLFLWKISLLLIYLLGQPMTGFLLTGKKCKSG